MIKVLHIIDSLEIGGAERLLVGVVNSLAGFEHHIICLSDKNTLRHLLNPEHKFKSLGFKTKKDFFRCVRTIRRYIRENGINIVHSHLVMANIIARLATPKKIPLFNSLHNLNGVKLFASRTSWQHLVEKMTYRKRHFTISVSQAVLDDYTKYIGLKGPSVVLYNFADDRFFSEKPADRKDTDSLRMVAVGSFKPQKNFSFLIHAMKGLPGNVTLDIYGDGALRKQLEGEISESNVAVRLMGVHNSIHEVLKEYDLYVMSSKYEGHPVALLEAMAAGMPALVADIPVLKEATGGKGLFFSLDNFESFQKLVLGIVKNEIDLKSHASYNHAFANRVARKDKYMESLASLYRNALKES